MAPSYRQDLPPAGGYRAIVWERVPLKPYFKGTTLFAMFAASTTISMYIYSLQFKKNNRVRLEVNDAKLAIHPFLLAERDREYLKQIRRNRDEEADLMKNVPGWKVGGFNGEPIFKTVKDEIWVDPNIEEYYVHTDRKNQIKRQTLSWYQ